MSTIFKQVLATFPDCSRDKVDIISEYSKRMLGSVDTWDANKARGAKSDQLGAKNGPNFSASSDHIAFKIGPNVSSKEPQYVKSGPKVTDQLGTDLQVSDRVGSIKGGQIRGGPIGGAKNGGGPIRGGQKIAQHDKGPKNPPKNGSGWIPPLRAKRIYMQRRVLTKHEETEILSYPRIYFTGQSATKVTQIFTQP